ncbi:Malate dehydrogenase [Giardia duodenalis]|uniref:Malate dehydrogenase n=1 Tax=Giardia intestinalis TaxID=5741 RepID=V6TZG6_GIAIN|nr:Malate dehydrogenase [Giardia intestinalis]
MRCGAAASHVNGTPCHTGPGMDIDTRLADGQHALQRGVEGPTPKGSTARSTRTGSVGDGPREFGRCLPCTRRAGYAGEQGSAVSGLTNSPGCGHSSRRLLVYAAESTGIYTDEASEKGGHRNSAGF